MDDNIYKINVLGININTFNIEDALKHIESWIEKKEKIIYVFVQIILLWKAKKTSCFITY